MNFINWHNFENIYIYPGRTDMRKAINGLLVIVENQMKLNVFQNSVFLFCGLNKRNLKGIFWDKNGFCLVQKKLDVDKYAWPRTGNDVMKLTHEDLNLLLQGFDIEARHKELKYLSVT